MEIYSSKEPDAADCRICGAKSTGLHYGVITCEGCKVFYKRYMGKHQHYRCYFGGACHIDLRTRSRCKACRFKKCLEEGMSVEAIRLGRMPKMFKPSHSDFQVRSGNFGDAPRRTVQALPPKPEDRTYRGQTEASVTNYSVKDHFLSASTSPPSPPNDHKWSPPGSVIHSPVGTGSSRFSITRFPAFDPNEIRATLSFSDENLNFMLNDFISDFMEYPAFQPFIRPGIVPKIKLPSLPTHQQITSPTMLQKYWGVMKARNSVLEDSIKSVTDATDVVFGTDIRENKLAVRRFLVEGQIPYQPETTLDNMMLYCQESVAALAERLFRYLVLIPGFTDLSPNDRTSIVRDRWYVAWLITHAHCYVNEECYHPIGPYSFHYCRYWMRHMLDANFVRFIFSVTGDINDLRLNTAETYMLLTVALFRTDADDSLEDKAYIDFLYSHYLDGLIHLIGPGRGDLLMKLRAVVGRFAVVNEVHRRFILQANLEQAPISGAWDTDDMAAVTLKSAPLDGFVPTSVPNNAAGH